MEQETIVEAAFNYAAQRFPNGENKDCGIVAQEQYACRAGFMAGAEWQRNHVWHKTCDIVEPGRDCLVEYMDGHGNVCIRIDRRTEYEWVNASHYDKILRWAYLDDLMPTSFDEILEENKDVLQRLKKGEVK